MDYYTPAIHSHFWQHPAIALCFFQATHNVDAFFVPCLLENPMHDFVLTGLIRFSLTAIFT